MEVPDKIVAQAMSSDGHVRITRGEGFQALGGNEDDHAVAAEIAERFVEGVGDRRLTVRVAREALEKAVERTLGFRGRS